MATLREQAENPEKRKLIIKDALQVLDQEVDDKTGLGGMAVKAAYKLVKGISPGFLEQVVNHLLDDFLDAIEPMYREALDKQRAPGDYLVEHKVRMANSLLGVTDRRAVNAQRAVIKKTYDKLRPSAQKHVEAAAPRLGWLLGRHATGS